MSSAGEAAREAARGAGGAAAGATGRTAGGVPESAIATEGGAPPDRPAGRVGPVAEWALARVTWRLLLSRRRWAIVIVASGLPLLAAWIFVSQAGEGAPDAGGFYAVLTSTMVLTVLLPLAALIHGTGTFGLELDDGTLRYVLARPVARTRIVLVKWLVAAAASVVSVLPGVILTGWITLGEAAPPVILGFALAVVVASFLYTALFMALSLVTRRALLLGLIYVLAWEGGLATLFAGTRVFSVREYALVAAEAVAGGEVLAVLSTTLEPFSAFLLGLGMVGGALAFSVHRVRGIEVMEEV